MFAPTDQVRHKRLLAGGIAVSPVPVACAYQRGAIHMLVATRD